jgi:6-phosphogluconate dehydrogenase
MDVGLLGLGRMGTTLGGLAAERGHRVVVWDPDDDARREAVDLGLEAHDRLDAVPAALAPPRVVLLSVPHGDVVDRDVDALADLLEPGDLVADLGNSHWQRSTDRAARLDAAGIAFVDVGTSGGTSRAPGWAGAAFMAGGRADDVDRLRPLLCDLADDERAVLHAGPAGAGHFVKLVHNAIEFGMIQAIADGVELLRRSEFDLDLAALFEHWDHGTVIRSWLVELMAVALREEPDWDGLSTYVEDTGEVKWVLHWALDRDIPTPAVEAAQRALLTYRDEDRPAARAVALLRHQFGGHPVHRTS